MAEACVDNTSGDEDELTTSIQAKRFGSSIGMMQVDLASDEDEGNDDDSTSSLNPGRDIMRRFFNTWDEDDSGFLDVEEVLQGVQKFCDAMDLDYDSRRVSALFDQLDADGSQELDRKEFTVFLQKYAELNDISMEDLAYVMATEEMGSDEPVVQTRRRTSDPAIFFTNLFSAMAMKQNNDAKRVAVPEPAKKPPKQSLASFFSRFDRKKPEEAETVADTTVEDSKAGVPTSDDAINATMWDMSTEDAANFAHATEDM
jgi:hypothetical protein